MFTPVGTVKNNIFEKMESGWGRVVSEIVVLPEYAPGLQGLTEFSHLLVLTWMKNTNFSTEKHLVRRPRAHADMPQVGVFAQRSKNRPSPIGVTAVSLLRVEGNIVRVKGLDAIDGTPVLDIKPYFPLFDQRIDVKVPHWLDDLMDDYF